MDRILPIMLDVPSQVRASVGDDFVARDVAYGEQVQLAQTNASGSIPIISEEWPKMFAVGTTVFFGQESLRHWLKKPMLRL